MNPSTYTSFAYHALRMRASKSYRVPFTINVQLLLKCPLSCVYCPQEHDSTTALPLDVVKGIFDDGRSMGTRRVHLTGGEPLLRRDLPEIVDYAKSLGLFVSLTTSGVRVESHLDTLMKVDQVQLSFDGPSETRGLLRGAAGAKVSQRAVELFVENGIDFWTSTVLTSANIDAIDWIVDHAREHGIHANFVLMEAHPEDWNGARPMSEEVRELFPSPEENRRAIEKLVDLKRGGAPIGSSMPYLRELLEWEDYSQLSSANQSKRYRCMAPQSQCEVLANGDLHVCDWTLQRNLGVSVHEHGFKGAFERLAQPHDCNSCISACYLESNLIFSLNPQTVANWGARLLLSGLRGRRGTRLVAAPAAEPRLTPADGGSGDR
jgi:MoaA/NifB/PqqE/SkfB family radical SAM enzyme